jgi:hypothetical protein
MSSNAITEKEDRTTDRPFGGGLPPGREVGPSRIREDDPALARTIGMIGAALLVFGGMALGFNLYGKAVRVSTGWAVLIVAVGLCGLLFHAAYDRDEQFRRMYMMFSAVLLLVGAFLAVSPWPVYFAQFRYGVICLCLALLFALAFLRNETEERFRNAVQLGLGGAGAVMAVVGLVGGNIKGDFLVPVGLVLALVGLVYLVAFVGGRGLSDNLAYFTAVGLALAGVVVVLVCLGRAFIPHGGSSYFVSYGSVLLILGLLYTAGGAGMASDAPLFVLTRRELGAFFYSPMAYLVLIGFAVLCWIPYNLFLGQLITTNPMAGKPFEPIIQFYFFSFFPVVAVLFGVPVLTMRLLSEEQRTGTLEVLLTAPVDEPVVVLSKFVAALITYLVIWLPFGLYLLAIPLAGGRPFDYRPLLSFLFAVVVTGSAFLSMGLFFSSLTKNQVASGVLTFAGMLLLTAVHWGTDPNAEESGWRVVLNHISYIGLWANALEGKITPRLYVFPLSMTVLFLFMTVKVLESRKWR